MVSLRCKLIVKSELEKLGLNFTVVELGEVEIIGELTSRKKLLLKQALLAFGFELMEDRKSIMIEKIKNIIVEMIHYSDEPPAINFSDYLSAKLNYEYHYLSNLFSEVKGITIEHYIISHKIDGQKNFLFIMNLPLQKLLISFTTAA